MVLNLRLLSRSRYEKEMIPLALARGIICRAEGIMSIILAFQLDSLPFVVGIVRQNFMEMGVN